MTLTFALGLGIIAALTSLTVVHLQEKAEAWEQARHKED